MNKHAAYESFKVDDMPSMQSYLQDNATRKFNEVLKQACENYLGRPIDLEKDTEIFRLEEWQGTNETKLFAHDKHIGSIKTDFGQMEHDFVNNKITYTITFTPVL